jgi:ubiquinone/menaquinone biosynthesis C-methylase UbiE
MIASCQAAYHQLDRCAGNRRKSTFMRGPADMDGPARRTYVRRKEPGAVLGLERTAMAEEQARSPYRGSAEYWSSAATRAWAEEYERMDRALAGLGKRVLELAAPQPGECVLDIGCGSGTTVLALAARVGPSGHVLGADIAEQSVARARERIAAAGYRHAEAICADVARHPFAPERFDLAFSRLGVMFFDDPPAALANVHRAMKPGGRLALAVFRPASENLWPAAPLASVRHLLPPMPLARPDEPGSMFSWGDPARVQQILETAGFREPSLTPVDAAFQLAAAGGAAEAAQFALLFGPLTRLLPGLTRAQQEAVRSALEAFFEGHATPQGVWLPSAFWIVQGRA